MTKPIWLMDVDGVLNDWRFGQVANDWTRFEAASGWSITYSKSILQRIISLHESGVVEVKWLTTWCNRANAELREEFGFAEDLDVLGTPQYKAEAQDYRLMRSRNESDRKFGWWKLNAVDEFVKENSDQRIIWTDDDIADDRETKVFLKDNPQIFAVSPSPFLSHNDLDTIESWINT